MIDIFTVSFFGHRKIDNFSDAKEQVEELIYRLIDTKQYVEFLIGRNGEFDQLVSSTIRKIKREYRDDNCRHILVLPYYNAEYQNNYNSFNNYYDEVEICEKSYKSYFKSAFQKRNCEMIDRSDLVVFYLEKEYGGAYQTYKYAAKNNKKIIKLPFNE